MDKLIEKIEALKKPCDSPFTIGYDLALNKVLAIIRESTKGAKYRAANSVDENEDTHADIIERRERG